MKERMIELPVMQKLEPNLAYKQGVVVLEKYAVQSLRRLIRHANECGCNQCHQRVRKLSDWWFPDELTK